LAPSGKKHEQDSRGAYCYEGDVQYLLKKAVRKTKNALSIEKGDSVAP